MGIENSYLDPIFLVRLTRPFEKFQLNFYLGDNNLDTQQITTNWQSKELGYYGIEKNNHDHFFIFFPF